MNVSNFKKGVVGLVAILPFLFSPVLADDTEIYFGNDSASVTSIQPNILFVLDTSGSMAWEAGDTGVSRLDTMKEALRRLISDTNNVNMGLMRFNRPGGAVIYPVTDIDKPIDIVDTGNIVTSISDAADDAQQSSSGVVELDSVYVSMGKVATGGAESFEMLIGEKHNDAEEKVSGGDIGNVRSGGDTLNLMSVSSGRERLIGLRFSSPPGELTSAATVSSAFLEFTNSGGSSDTDFLEITIRAELGGDDGNFQPDKSISTRKLTDKSVVWSPGDFDGLGKLKTIDLSELITEVIEDAGWSAGDPLTFILKLSGGSGRRVVRSFDGDSSIQPKLVLNIGAASPVLEEQIAGLRFQSVGVPKGVLITKASLEFSVAEASTVPETLSIKAEDTGNASAFTDTDNNLGVIARPRGAAVATWAPLDWDTVGAIEESVDITGVIQEIVRHTDWCGNNAMALFVSGLGSRVATSYDGSSSLAPRLKIEYDTSSVPVDGSSCFNKEYSYRVVNSSDDAEERPGEDVNLGSSDLELVEEGSADQEVGIRFKNIRVQQGADIESAYLEFTSKDDTYSDTSLTIYAHDTVDAPTFDNSTNTVIARPKTVGVDWTALTTLPKWKKDVTYRSQDISTIVQLIVDKAGWSAGNNMAFIIEGSGLRRAYSMDGSAGQAARLIIQAKSTSGDAYTETARDKLLEVVDGIQHQSGTPIVGSYYEAAQYFRGGPVTHGLIRGEPGSSRLEHGRVSHRDSWDDTAGTVVQPVGCTDEIPSATECKAEYIDGNPNYISPIIDACQKNHIVILTDGSATVNESEGLIKTLIGGGLSCVDSDSEACGPELAAWLRTTDQDPENKLLGDQTITTHTIAFNFTGDWIKSLSENGGGAHYPAETADELASVFDSIVTHALKSNSTFVSPAVAVNQFNRLNHLNDIYFAVFKPTEEARWGGNVKKYVLDGPDNDIEDSVGALAVDQTTGFFKDSSKSFWSSVADGSSVTVGGAAENLPAYDGLRRTYTYTGSSLSLADSTNEVSASNALITGEMLGDAALTTDERTELLQWIGGKDVKNEDGDASTLTRKSMSDPLHSKPLVFTHGGTAVSPEMALLFGTNDGHFRALNADTGVELWSFIPPSLLPVSKVLFDNVASTHPYGVDGSPVMWINDPDFDGTSVDLSGTDNFAYVYFGLRRGGRNYYALDVSNINSPKAKWRIEGGSTGFEELGQTWAKPIKTRIGLKGESAPRDVLIFSGGYDPDQDDATARTKDDQGRAMFIVDAKTGALIWSGGPTSSGFDEGFTVAKAGGEGMAYSIPAAPAVADLNGDGLADQMYVGDMGGQIWRFDIINGESPDKLVEGGVIATFASDGSAAGARRFYHTPDLALSKDSAGDTQINILIGSGFHAHPLNNSVLDRFYMLRMSDAYDVPSTYALDTSSLHNATSNSVAEGNAAAKALALTELNSGPGWFFDMPNTGEKVLSSPLIIDGQVVFTTYEPEPSTSGCVVQPGTTREYVVDVLNATPTVNLDDPDTDDALVAADRSRTLATGSIVDEPVIIFTEEGGGTSFLGTAKGSVNIGTNRIIKTFWYQE